MGTTTWSRSAAKLVQGSHVFEISGYSLHREVVGAFPKVDSTVFAFGGYKWVIWFYPGGIVEGYKDYVSVYVYLKSKNNDTRVRASVQFSLVDVTRSLPPHMKTKEFDSSRSRYRGRNKFKKRSKLEGSPYLRDDRITIECIITIVKESQVSCVAEVEMPPSDITEHLGKLLQGKENTDVIFEVGGVAFLAHKTVVAMRSPVFKEELYGAMSEKDRSRIIIGDMQPAVFDALLYFIYTDSMPTMDDLDRDDYVETIRHLIVAADRYAMERLKVICESILCKNIDVNTVMTTVALADQHQCGRLIDACVHFIASLDTKELDDVMSSQGYAELKSTCPLTLVELWEKKDRLGKLKS